MLNKIFHKFSALLIFVIIIFLAFILFIIFPQIRNFFYQSEIQNIQNQLIHVEKMIASEAKNLDKFEELALLNARDDIMRVSKTAHRLMQSFYNDHKVGKLTLNQARNISLETIEKIKFGHASAEDNYVFVMDPKGVYWLHPNKQLMGKNMYDAQDITGQYVNQEIIQKTLKDGTAFSTYFWPKSKGNATYKKLTYSMYFEPLDLIIVTGIYLDEIQKQSHLKNYIVMNNLKKMLEKYTLFEDGFVFISDGEKLVIIKDKYKEALLKKTGLHEKIKRAYIDKTPFKYTIDKVEKVALVQYNEQFKWYVVGNIKESDLYLKATRLNGLILNATLISLFIMFLFGLLIIRKVVTPINELSRNALKVKEGNFKVRNLIFTNDEMGILAKQFNVMLDTIEDNIKNLEEKIDVRTQELKQQLYYDDLTGLKNRNSFLKYVEDESFSTVVLMDINDFDDINELYGYKIGNEVLSKFTQYAEPLCKENGTELYRIYGNTFAILYLNDLFNFEEFESFIHGLLASVKKHPLHVDELNIELFVDVTLGIAICQDSPLKKANIALRKAKKSSSNFFVFNNEVDTKKVIENTIFWRNKIKDAVDGNKIVPFFQPIVNGQQEIVKYETLMRLEDESDDGMISFISPYKFMDISIKTKQYATISNMLVGKALDALESTNKTISINLSFSDINDVHFLNFIEEKFTTVKSKNYSRIVFEILESDGILSYDTLENFINKYRKLGVKIAIDDFGTGYSNFSHIMKIRPDYLKIDSSLIKDIDVNSDSYALVKSIVVFSKALNIKTIAEFVHSKEVFEKTLELGVDEFQGYYFGRPCSEFVKELSNT